MNARWRRYLRFFGPDVAADVEDELRFHLDMRARDYVERGFHSDDADAAARERFGDYHAVSAALHEHDYRLARTRQRRDLVDDAIQDIRYALRSLRRAPAFSVVAILTLALGVGANTAVFSIVDAVVIRQLPYARPTELVAITGSTLGEFTRVAELNRSFSAVAAYRTTGVGISGDATPERVPAASVSANLFSTLGTSAAVGRTFVSGENGAGRADIVLLGDGLWRRRFGSDRNVIGRSVMIEGRPHTIVGVMPAGFGFPTHDTQLWTPFVPPPSRSGAFWGSGGYQVIARVRPGVSIAQAQQELRTLYSQIRHENPIWDPGPTYRTNAIVTPLQERIVGSARTMLLLLFGVVGVVLLIACANVANLLLVHATARRKEIVVRMALGGGRGRLLRQLLTESVVLAALGGVVGIAFAWSGIRGLTALVPPDVPRIAQIGLDARVLAFTTGLVLLTGFFFGLLPALRSIGPSVQSALRDGSRTSGGSHRRLASALVAVEIGAAVLLVIAATLLIRSLSALHRINPGYRVESIVTARINPPDVRFAAPKDVHALTSELVRRARALPGVEAAAVVDRAPLDNGGGGGTAVRIEGQFESLGRASTGAPGGSTLPMADHYLRASPEYFATMGIPVIAGRGISADDRAGSGVEVVVVSESFARHHWPGTSAIGKRIGYPWPSEWITVVGVVKDTKLDSLTGKTDEAIYRPIAQAAGAGPLALVVRTSSDIGSLSAALRSVVAQIDAGIPVSNVTTMRSAIDRSAGRQVFTMRLLAIFAGIAVLLGVIGIYGVMSYAVAQRTREIGVRMALGAGPRDALRMVLGESLVIATAGVIVGVIAASLSTRALAGLLYGVTATDPVTFVVVPIGLTIVALAASYVPARRATRIDPTAALRSD